MQHNKILTLALIASIVAGTVSAQTQDRSGELEHVVYRSKRFASKALGFKVRFALYLPKTYRAEKNAEKRYPVIYFLHGMNEDHLRFKSRGGAQVLDKLVGDKTLPDHIFVCVNDTNRRSFYINGNERKIEDMLLHDLLPFVDANFRTNKNPASRAILGVSMGGFGALKIAFRHPKLFGVVATHSAAILPERFGDLEKVFPWARRAGGMVTSIFGDPVDEKMWAAENPMTLARSLDKKKLGGLRVYFDCGDRDRYRFDGPNQQLDKLLTKRKIAHTFQMVAGGEHGWRSGYNQSRLPHSLAFIAAAWSQRAGASGLADALGGKGDTPPVKKDRK